MKTFKSCYFSYVWVKVVKKVSILAQVLSIISLVVLKGCSVVGVSEFYLWLFIAWNSMEYFLHHHNQDVRKITKRLERLHLEILKRKQSAFFNRTCLDNNLPLKSLKYIYIYIYKLVDCSRGWPKRSFFNCYNTEVEGKLQLLSLNCATYPWFLSENAEC